MTIERARATLATTVSDEIPSRHFDDDYREVIALHDGSHVTLRLVQPADKELFVRGLGELSKESRYRRFFTDKDHLTAAELSYLTEIDQHQHFALGAVGEDDEGRPVPCGVARFVRLADEPEVAEAAIAVVDHMHRKGLGRLLLLRLIAAARERGVLLFRSDVLADNRAMLEMLDHIGLEHVDRTEDDMVTVTMRLPDLSVDEPPETERGRGASYRLMAMVAERLVLVRTLLRQLRHR
jgi:GNAT superfamily N-acetyltransferase